MADDATPAQAYLDRLLRANAAAVADLDHSVRCASVAAELLVRDPDGPGPSLWLAGDTGFVIEGFTRAGGLMIAKRLSEPGEVEADDVVLVGSLHGDDAATADLLSAIARQGGQAVLFAPRNASVEAGHLFIDTHGDPPGGECLPTASPAGAQSLWAFTGELVTAMMRSAGRMPPIFVSVLVPDGRERNEARRGLRWDPRMAGPLPEGLAARRYLARLANIMRRLRATQADEFARAGRMAASVLADGGTVWYAPVGHLPPYQPAQAPEDAPPFEVLERREPGDLSEVVEPGDLIMYVGYYEPFGPWVERAHDAGAQIVTVVAGTPERDAARMGADVNIRGCWPYGDALVGFRPPETDITMLPPSGVVQSAAVWMLLAETDAALR